jgi:tetrapyrrole methylase family protein / MazG family protein
MPRHLKIKDKSSRMSVARYGFISYTKKVWCLIRNDSEVQMKKKEKKGKVTRRLTRRGPEKVWRSILEGVRKDSSSLSQAYQLTRIASRAGFDWPNIEGVLEKLDEEMREFREALALQDRKKICEEIGDLLFVLANVSRSLHLHPEKALKKTLDKFVSRFHYIEASLHQEGKSLRQSDLVEMDRLWEKSKKKKIK